jgi:hypothetical protein
VGRYAKQYFYEGANVNLEDGFVKVNYLGRDSNNRLIVKLTRAIPLGAIHSIDVIW